MIQTTEPIERKLTTGFQLLAISLMTFLLTIVVPTTPLKAFGDWGSSSDTNCSAGKRWCKKKNKCVNSRCRKGRVWSSSNCSCVRRSSQMLGDDDLYFEAVTLAKSNRYEEALSFLHRIKNQKQARVLNYIGYSTRKLGHLEEGLVYYEKALKLDPDYTLAREYLGEGLLQKGDLAGANVQLAEIAKRCDPTTCHEYLDLAEKIEKYVKKQR